MEDGLDYIRVENYHKSSKKKHRRARRTAWTALIILLFLLLVATVFFFIIAGRNSDVAITEGAESAYVPVTSDEKETGETEDQTVPATPEPTPIPTPEPTPEPTPTPKPVNNNPTNGMVLVRKFSDQVCKVNITNELEKDCCVVMNHVKTEMDAIIVFVRAGESCQVSTPNGTYAFTAKVGDNYLTTDSYFGSETETIDLGTASIPWGETYNITVSR